MVVGVLAYPVPIRLRGLGVAALVVAVSAALSTLTARSLGY